VRVVLTLLRRLIRPLLIAGVLTAVRQALLARNEKRLAKH